MFDIVWSRGADGVNFTYGDVYLEERAPVLALAQVADTDFLFQRFNDREAEVPAHAGGGPAAAGLRQRAEVCRAFNLLDARGVISATERLHPARAHHRQRRCAPRIWSTWWASKPGVDDRGRGGRTMGSLHTLAFRDRHRGGDSGVRHRRATSTAGRLVPEGLDAVRIRTGDVAVYTTPRRLIAIVADVCDGTEALEVFRGRRQIAFDAGNPTKAATGFARGEAWTWTRSNAAGNGVEYVFATTSIAARDVAELLPGVLEGVITGISWPKSCRWGTTSEYFSRPVRWLVALLDERDPCGSRARPATSRAVIASGPRGPHEISPAPICCWRRRGRARGGIPSEQAREGGHPRGRGAGRAAHGRPRQSCPRRRFWSCEPLRAANGAGGHVRRGSCASPRDHRRRHAHAPTLLPLYDADGKPDQQLHRH